MEQHLKGTTRWDEERPAAPLKDGMNSQERSALVTWLLCHGGRYSDAEIAALCGMGGRNSAYYLMSNLARVLPVWRNEEDGRWELVGDD